MPVGAAKPGAGVPHLYQHRRGAVRPGRRAGGPVPGRRPCGGAGGIRRHSVPELHRARQKRRPAGDAVRSGGRRRGQCVSAAGPERPADRRAHGPAAGSVPAGPSAAEKDRISGSGPGRDRRALALADGDKLRQRAGRHPRRRPPGAAGVRARGAGVRRGKEHPHLCAQPGRGHLAGLGHGQRRGVPLGLGQAVSGPGRSGRRGSVSRPGAGPGDVPHLRIAHGHRDHVSGRAGERRYSDHRTFHRRDNGAQERHRALLGHGQLRPGGIWCRPPWRATRTLWAW